jgi:micrococcal nuclease
MKKFCWLVFIILITQCVEPETTGTVVAIADGDTFTMLTPEHEQIKVRLYGIDAPERGQDFAKVSKQFLSDLIYGRKVIVIQLDTDQYGRTIALVEVDGTSVNEEMLKAGLAWHYTQFDINEKWTQLEAEARTSRKGLWSVQNPVAPWHFRKAKRKRVHQ